MASIYVDTEYITYLHNFKIFTLFTVRPYHII